MNDDRSAAEDELSLAVESIEVEEVLEADVLEVDAAESSLGGGGGGGICPMPCVSADDRPDDCVPDDSRSLRNEARALSSWLELVDVVELVLVPVDVASVEAVLDELSVPSVDVSELVLDGGPGGGGGGAPACPTASPCDDELDPESALAPSCAKKAAMAAPICVDAPELSTVGVTAAVEAVDVVAVAEVEVESPDCAD